RAFRASVRHAIVPLGVAASLLFAAPAHAQVITKNLVRAFNQCTYPAQYVFDATPFTAAGPEAMLTFSRTHVACSPRCQTLPYFPYQTSCDTPCRYNDDPCPYGWRCGLNCFTNGCLGQCAAGVDVNVGYVVVMKATRYCSIAACAGPLPLI